MQSIDTSRAVAGTPPPHRHGAANPRRTWRSLAALLAGSVLLAGCATQPNGRGGLLIGVDTAELFGTVVDTFRVQGGAEGTLRRASNGAYSIKLGGSFRVIPFNNLMTARVARVENIGARTVVLVETQQRNCPYKYEVLSIQGSDVLQWQVGNCNDRPRVDVASDAQSLTIDFPAYNRIQRNTYIDSRVLTSSITPPPGTNLSVRPYADASLHAPAGSATPAGPALSGSTPASGVRTAPGLPGDAPSRSGDNGTASARTLPLPPQRAGATGNTSSSNSSNSTGASSASTSTNAGSTSSTSDSNRRSPASSSSRNTEAARAPAAMAFPTQEVLPAAHLDLRK